MNDLELVLGGPAAGGGFAARDDDGRVVFVRHGLPGERVRVRLTEEHPRWARGDAIEILEASPDRVDPPCPHAGPSRCGGCDYQHVELAAQRRFKAELLSAQLARVAKVDLAVVVEAAEPGGTGLGTRTRLRFGVLEDGRLGMRRHRRHELVPIDRCALGVDEIDSLALGTRRFPPGADVVVSAPVGPSLPTAIVQATSSSARDGAGEQVTATVQHAVVGDHRFQLTPGTFFQAHRAAPEILSDAVLEGLAIAEGDHVLDLYCGAGLFTVPIAAAVGGEGSVVGVEQAPSAVLDAEANLADFPWAQVIHSGVDASALDALSARWTKVVVDPPRSGLGRGVVAAIGARAEVERVVSVSCDAATFARDLRGFLDEGFGLSSLRAFDLFEMTEHLEIVAVLDRPGVLDRSAAQGL